MEAVIELMPQRVSLDEEGNPKPRRRRVHVDELMGVGDIAKLFGVTNQHVQGFIQRRAGNGFPEEVGRVSGATLFLRPEIERWMAERNSKRPTGRQHRILGPGETQEE